MTDRAEIKRHSRSHSNGSKVEGARPSSSRSTSSRGTATASRTSEKTSSRTTSHSGGTKGRRPAPPKKHAILRPTPPARRIEGKLDSTVVDRQMRVRLAMTMGIICALLVGLLGRVVYIQTIDRSQYLSASIDQRTRQNILRASRGVIFDRAGNELAMSVPSTTVYADPRGVTDIPGTAHTIAELLHYTPEQETALVTKMSAPGSKFVYIAREMTATEAKAITDLGMPGISSYTEPAREVEGNVASSVIGKTDPDGTGTSGLELQYNKGLTGVDGKIIRQVDKNGRSIAGTNNAVQQSIPGDDMVLTIDKTIQYQTDNALLERVNQLGAKGGTAIVLNTKTGEILAISNVRRGADGQATTNTGNFAAVEAYEPGSVAKVFSISALVNEGKATPDSVYSVPGAKMVDKFLIRDAWPHGTINMNLRTIVSESSNIGTMIASEALTSQQMHDYLSKFGFGQQTGLQYPSESKGILRAANKWRGTEAYTVSYGYGYAATPLQIVSAVNAVANKGVYVAPKLVKSTIDKQGKVVDTAPSATHQVISPDASATMVDLLRGVVCAGTGTLAQTKGMEIAGKTGTGYKVQANGTYSTDSGGRKYFASFTGFFPASDPQITMLVSVDEPNANSRDRFGGTAAAPVFSRLVPVIMSQMGIQPTGTGTGCAAGATAGH